MPAKENTLKILAFILGVWSADGYIGIYSRGVYRFAITLSANERDIAKIYQSEARKLGIIFKPLRYTNKKKTGAALELNSKDVVNMLLKFGAVPGRKTETNPPVPKWIKEKPEFIRNWFRGVVLGDGRIGLGCRIAWYRTTRIPSRNPVGQKLVNFIVTNPYAQFNRKTNGYRITQMHILKLFNEYVKRYTPRMLEDEIEMLSTLDIHPRIYYELNYYLKSKRLTATWTICVWNVNAIRFARFLEFSKTG